MPVTRRIVLEQLAAASDAEHEETTRPEELAAVLETDLTTIEAHLTGLAACELAHIDADGRVRITITGQQLLSLDTNELTIIAPDADQPDH